MHGRMDAAAPGLSGSIAWPCWVALGLMVALSVSWLVRHRPALEPGGTEDALGAAEGRIQELRETVDELTRARAAAVEAADRRDEFLATISHELRSPLNAILGWTQVLEPRDLPHDVGDALRVIRRNALRQRQLLDDLADMSRVVAGGVRIEQRPMELRDAIDEACQAVRPELERKGIHFTCGVDTTASINGDPRRMQQVFWNLLANAARFTPAGGAISIETVEEDSEIAIAVRDTGEGIEAAFLPHVFEPFRQQPRGTPRDHASFGLGLALVRIIVEAHGGRVTAHSEGPGRGATFTVVLPTLERGLARPPAAADAPAAAMSGAPLAGVRVLAVDDEPDWCDLLGRILAAAGAEARIARSAAEALRIYDEWRPDVLLTDIAMPGTDGYAFLAAIRSRALHGGTAVPALAMTAHAGAQERTRTARAGFVEHLAKPIPPQDLIESLRRVAGQLPGRGERGPSG
jgi:signal transduction histidine kinase/ActR/RegA family two-component response regulator